MVETSLEISELEKKMTKIWLAAILTSAALLCNQTAFSQSTKAPESQNVLLNVGTQPYKGNKNAKVILIEFADYECSFCGNYFRETEPQIERDYIKTNKVKYVFWDFPLKSHNDAFKAAEAARCAGDQEKYWEMHDRLFANQHSLGPRDLSKHAQAIRLDLQSFQPCLDNGKHAAEIRKDKEEATKVGVKVTPTFLLGLTEPNNPKVKAQKIISGAAPYTSFKEAIDSLLGSQR